MNERFLYYIWQFQYFRNAGLLSTGGDRVEIINPGILNSNSGPDFADASLRIGGLAWAGTVEIHMFSSDWNAHRHERDHAYENVILHVVWKEDQIVFRSSGTRLPCVELADRIDEALIRNYKKLIHNPFTIPCCRSLPKVPAVVKRTTIDKALVQRLESRASDVITLFKRTNNDWEETFWQMLARNFGFKINAEPFQQLGEALPYRIVRKHADKPIQVEALVFGQAGFLDVEAGDSYYLLLKREYELLAVKYSLTPAKLRRAQWKFLRLRPSNFPTVRLAQFSALAGQRSLLFSHVMEAQGYDMLINLLSVRQNDYWLEHYRFNKKSNSPVPNLGHSSIENIIINSAVPVLAAWGSYHADQQCLDRAIGLLQGLSSEENDMIRTWKSLGVKPDNAFDSQGLIELYTRYCQKKSCLACSIGASLLKPGEIV